MKKKRGLRRREGKNDGTAMLKKNEETKKKSNQEKGNEKKEKKMARSGRPNPMPYLLLVVILRVESRKFQAGLV